MAYEFQKLSEVEALTEVPEGASVLAEVNGDIKRVPGNGLGGSGGKVLIIIDNGDDAASPSAVIEDSPPRFTANMTLREAESALYNKELTFVCAYINYAGQAMVPCLIQNASDNFGIRCLVIAYYDNFTLFWTENGLSTVPPISPE